jgi:hypothetical protein
MCGKGPRDLDIGQTDIAMAHFQGLCSAWQSLDNDDYYPQFLADEGLPIPLGKYKVQILAI